MGLGMGSMDLDLDLDLAHESWFGLVINHFKVTLSGCIRNEIDKYDTYLY